MSVRSQGGDGQRGGGKIGRKRSQGGTIQGAGSTNSFPAHVPVNGFYEWWVKPDCSRWWSEAWSSYSSCLGGGEG